MYSFHANATRPGSPAWTAGVETGDKILNEVISIMRKYKVYLVVRGHASKEETGAPAYPAYAVRDNTELGCVELSYGGVTFRPYGMMDDRRLWGEQIGVRSDSPDSAIYAVITFICAPSPELFMAISGALILPVNEPAGVFVRRRWFWRFRWRAETVRPKSSRPKSAAPWSTGRRVRRSY